jgi:hypothetical protein
MGLAVLNMAVGEVLSGKPARAAGRNQKGLLVQVEFRADRLNDARVMGLICST